MIEIPFVQPTDRLGKPAVDRLSSHHRAFTLIELMVVVGVIGLLVSFSLPAVQRAREAAARLSCSNNLRQIGLGLSSYTAALNSFPLGTGIPNARSPARIVLLKQFSVLSQLLHFLDQRPLFDGVNFDVGLHDVLINPRGDRVSGIEANRTMMATSISVFLCPSDAATPPHGFGGCGYRSSMGADRWDPSHDGPFANGLRGVNPGGISDGMSQTMAFSEKLRGSGSAKGDPRRDMYQGGRGWPATAQQSYEACAHGLRPDSEFAGFGGACWLVGTLSQSTYNHVQVPNDPVPDCVLFGSNPLVGLVGARSNHPGGVNGVFCDGSVRFFKNGVNRQVWRALATRTGGEAIESTSY